MNSYQRNSREGYFLRKKGRKDDGVAVGFDWMEIVLFFFSVGFHALLLWAVLPAARFIKYQVAAQKYLEGSLPLERLLDFSPFYLGVHVLYDKIFSDPITAILWLQILTTGFAAVFLFKLLQFYFSQTVAVIGALLFILNHSVIIYTGTFEPEPFILFFLLGFLFFAHLYDRIGAVSAGILLGLCLLTRPNYLPLLVVFPFFYYFKHKGKSWVRLTLYWAGPVTLSVVLLLIRATLITGTFTPFAMNPGTVFYEGNNPASLGESAVYPYAVWDSRKDFPFDTDYRHEIYRIVARRTTQSTLTVQEVNDYWIEKAKHFILDHPRHFVSVLATKALFVFHGFKRHDIFYMYQKGKALKDVIPEIPFAVISAMALIGMFLFRNQWKNGLLIYASLAVQLSAMLVFYVSERQRLAILPLLIFFACASLNRLFRRIGTKWIVPLVALLCFFLYTENDIMADKRHVVERYAKGSEAIRKAADARHRGDWQQAAIANATALALTPWLAEDIRLAGIPFNHTSIEEQALLTARSFPEDSHPARFDLAALYMQCGRLDEAEMILNNLVREQRRFNRRSEQSSQPEFYLGRLYMQKKNRPAAVGHLKDALARNPGDPWALSHLFVLSGDETYKETLYRYFDDISAAFMIGKVFYDVGKDTEAVSYLRYVVKMIPEYRKAQIYLSLSLARSGEVEKAAKRFIKAINKRNDHVFHEQPVVRMFRDRLARNADNAAVAQDVVTTLRLFGRYEEAESLTKKAIN